MSFQLINYYFPPFNFSDVAYEHADKIRALPFGDALRGFLLSVGHSLLVFGEKLLLLPRRSSVNAHTKKRESEKTTTKG